MPKHQTLSHFYSINKSVIFYVALFFITLFSVLFIDRHLADFLYQKNFANSFTKLLSNTPVLLEALAGAVLLSCIIPKMRKKFSLLAIHLAITLAIASIVRLGAKALFGRTWPQTWVDNNPSWISDRLEGFHPFAEGLAYNSFPSGHALFTFALASVFWYHFPRFRSLWVATMLGVFIGQLAQNFHYLGDLLAGSVIGLLCAHLVIGFSRFAQQGAFKENSDNTKV
jgi:membrane-associated phospholipid phosphatase